MPENLNKSGEVSKMRFTKGQVITIKPDIVYGWRAWVTVEKDDPEHNQVWVKEIPRAVKYEHIEEDTELGSSSNPISGELLPMPPTEGPPLPRALGLRWPWKGENIAEKLAKRITDSLKEKGGV